MKTTFAHRVGRKIAIKSFNVPDEKRVFPKGKLDLVPTSAEALKFDPSSTRGSCKMGVPSTIIEGCLPGKSAIRAA